MSNNSQKSVEFLTQLKIKQLKNIKDLDMSFDKNKRLVAIFGENGCGKSTILYALACVFQKIKIKKIEKGKEIIVHTIGEDYRFTDFFPPTNLGQWNDSELELFYIENHQNKNRVYKKGKRWTRYEDRPYREIYFLGIDICVPQIELEKKTSQIKIEKDKSKKSEFDSDLIRDICYVMNKKYDEISFANNKKYRLAKSSNISYPSIFMGAGESKIIEILRVLHEAKENALILIDELDLTLHTSALKKLLGIMSKIADKKKLQIIFTSHREEISRFEDLRDKLDIKYITNRLSNKTDCLDSITSDGYLELTGENIVERIIYVEDSTAKAIVEQFLSINQLFDTTKVVACGAYENLFIVACGLFLSHRDLFEKSIFILDGDREEHSDNKKMERIQKIMTGTENYAEQNRSLILEKIIKFSTENKDSPEKFIFNEIMKLDDCFEKAILEKQNRNNTFGDNHKFLPKDSTQALRIISKFSEQPIWDSYTSELREKLINQQDA